MAVSAELLQKMLKAMDKDGDGHCSKSEFKSTYVEYMKEGGKGVSDQDYESVWTKIDKDKSGDVSVAELAEFYGFVVDAQGNVTSKEEDDDAAILEALRMAAHLEVTPAAPPPKKEEKIERCKSINMKVAPEDSLERQLLEEAEIGDIKRCNALVDKIKDNGKLSVRIEDSEKGQMPLHKLSRVGDQPDAIDLVKKLLEAGGKSKDDLNYQDQKGKTPLHLAAEHNQPALFKLLFDRGADPLKTTTTGWNALHCAVHAKNMTITKTLLESEKIRNKKKELVSTTDSQGRAPLHIAAFRADDGSELVKLLVDHGADAKQQDSGGLSAATLAGKSGRRKSRELLDALAN